MSASVDGFVAAPILVTGGTGTLGRLVVPRLRAAGRTVRVLSRRGGPDEDGVEHVTGDLATGDGVAAAVDGIEIVMHLAGTGKGDEDKARHLVHAARRERIRHLVYISVVGADRVPIESAIDRAMFGYFGSKREAELVIAESGLPWTTLRATQFQDAFLTLARAISKLPVIPVASGVRFQPIDADEVACRLVELALGHPAGLVPEIGGPRVYGMGDLVRGFLRADRRRRRPVLSIRLPGRAARAFRDGANLTPSGAIGRRTWEEFLVARVG